MLNVQCRMVAPLVEKMVRPPFLYLMSILLTPVVIRRGCNCGVAAGLNGVLARFWTAEPISFQPRSRSFMISITLMLPVLLKASTALASSKRSADLCVRRVGIGNHPAAHGVLAKANEIVSTVDHRNRRRHGQDRRTADCSADIVRSSERVVPASVNCTFVNVKMTEAAPTTGTPFLFHW